MSETCETCKFWDRYTCRRYPPQVYSDPYEGVDFRQPRTEPKDFCGEWKPVDAANKEG